MIRLLTLALVVCTASIVQAQQGTVTYTVTTQLDIELPPELADMQDQFPSEQVTERILLFDESASSMRAVPTDDSAQRQRGFQNADEQDVQVVFRDSGADGDEQTHVDLATGVITEKRSFLGRAFRVVGERPDVPWRLTGERSEFLGYPCQQAVAQVDSMTVEAWFTTEIPAPVGPDVYGGLPGAILVLAAGDRTFEATGVDLSPLAPGAIELPTRGDEVTREEFAAIVEERIRDLETTGLSTTTSRDGTRRTTRVFRTNRN
ncbi:MAG: GLPGLI family protein [Bacteroidota bacterium]